MNKLLGWTVITTMGVVVGCGSGNFGSPAGAGGTTGSGAAGSRSSGSGGTSGGGGSIGSAGAGGANDAGTSGTSSGGAGGTNSGGSSGQGGVDAIAGHGGTGGAAGRASGGSGRRSNGGAGGTAGAAGAGGTAGAAGTGGNTTTEYRPCPTNGDVCRILPLGDSITYGYTYTGAYRVKLFATATAAHQKMTFTGSLTDGPSTVAGVAFPQHNEGHSGWRIAQLTPLIPSPALDAGSGGIPHIVLLHIGTNDTCCTGVANMTANLATLIDKVTSAAPDALVIVAKITPLMNVTYNAAVKAYNSSIPDLVSARAAAGKHVVMIDMNTDFPTSEMLSDGIHPNQAGYEWMADRWYATIGSLLPQ